MKGGPKPLGLGLAALWLTTAMGPFERNDSHVAEGMNAYDKGQYEDALKHFDEAKKDHPQSAAVEFDRGNALYKLGRLDEARQAYQGVSELDQADLRAKDYYNLGDAWASLGSDKEAIAAFRKSLTLDPSDEQARHNLEVLLRKIPPPKQSGADGGTDGGSPDGGRDGGRPDAGNDGGSDGGNDGGRDGGADGGPQGDGGADGGGDGGHGDGGSGQGKHQRSDAGQGQPSESGPGADGGEGTDGGEEQHPERRARDAGIVEAGRLSKEEAERLLNSMKRDEKNLQLWRFQQRKPKKTSDKDW